MNWFRKQVNFIQTVFDKWWGGIEGSQIKWEEQTRNWEDIK